ncbi:Crp/Fnr family transcriptional regulator [Ferviditalea candida]|uniref:Crp/Fnr family transcriptional regulator n=1 Tax=Ferviditalea candida TaxID=3108399 RepID=A0ABU5ZJI6_9BACL|nr:Crp/Fnr family transcriptional regulator [Paenibacillaceae bacterium T2]
MAVMTQQQTTTSKDENGSYFNADHFELMQSIMYPHKAKKGAYLFWEGEDAGKLYYIRSGRVKLLKSTEDGRNLILSIMRQGDLFGELGSFGEGLNSFSAEIIEDADIGIIQKKDLEVLLYQHGDFAVEFMKWMAMMHQTTQSKFRDLLFYGKQGALASTLIRMSNSYGVHCTEGTRLNIKLTNAEIADMIGATRESVNRMLSAFKDEGIVEMKNGKLVIRRMEDLRYVCNCPKYPACPKEICRI